ncbi:hypothetical protein XENOCAPTIV_014230, partial [Xenoophorus captivus]
PDGHVSKYSLSWLAKNSYEGRKKATEQPRVPIQVFHCLRHEGTGGRTLLVDGFYAAEKLRQRSPEKFELLCRVPIRHEYIENTDNHQNHMMGVGPVLNVYSWNNELYMIRYADAEIE